MRRIHVFITVLAASLTSLSLLVAVSLYLSTTAPAWMPQMWNGMGMNGMMSGNNGNYASTAPSYLWIIPAALIGIVAISVTGVGFYLAFPQFKTGTEAAATQGASSTPYESVSKTLTAEERKVLNVLVAHQGTYLQKYIRKEAELSRLKTHRIIARFAERGIVTLKQSGNTNEVSLADWLNDSKAQNSA